MKKNRIDEIMKSVDIFLKLLGKKWQVVLTFVYYVAYLIMIYFSLLIISEKCHISRKSVDARNVEKDASPASTISWIYHTAVK